MTVCSRLLFGASREEYARRPLCGSLTRGEVISPDRSNEIYRRRAHLCEGDIKDINYFYLPPKNGPGGVISRLYMILAGARQFLSARLRVALCNRNRFSERFIERKICIALLSSATNGIHD